MNAYKIYSTLDLNDKMPQYPFTFVQAVAACWIPWLWYKIADPLVDKVLSGGRLTQKQLSKARNYVQAVILVLAMLLFINAYTGYDSSDI